jgi:LysR family glycine cleavage system transcriptional activator
VKKTHTLARPKRRLPSLHALQVFEAVARHGSITAAAQDLHVTHGAVSRQVKALEADLDQRLLRRSGRGIRLTPAGELLRPELEAALGRIARAVECVAERTTRLTLNINVTPSFAARCLIPRLGSFCRKNPAIDLRIGTSDSRLDFDPQECDISIRSLYAREVRTLRRRCDWQNAGLHPFLEEANFPVCSPALLRKRPLHRISDLRNETLLYARSVPSAWSEWLNNVGASRIEAKAGVTFDNFHFALLAAARGIGIAMGTAPLVKEALETGALVKPFPGIEGERLSYYAICPRANMQRPEVEVFLTWLKSEWRSAPQRGV